MYMYWVLELLLSLIIYQTVILTNILIHIRFALIVNFRSLFSFVSRGNIVSKNVDDSFFKIFFFVLKQNPSKRVYYHKNPCVLSQQLL